MKVWIKYLIGIALGLAAAFIIPSANPAATAVISAASEFAIRAARYTVLPLMFFGVSMAVFKLRNSNQLTKTALWTIGAILGTTLILTVLGLISILIFKLPRIPITGEKMTDLPSIVLKKMIMQILPYSGFNSIADGAYLLPCFIFAGFAGAGCTTDQVASKPLVSFLDSAAKVCYSIMTFFIEWVSIGMIAIACYWMVSAKAIFASRIYTPLILMLTIDFILAIALIYPLIIRFLCNDLHPMHVLFASITPILAAFFSADSNMSLPVNLRHARESLGQHQQAADVSVSLFSIFGRGGSALVTAICFVTILRSYSSLGFTAFDVVWIFITTFAISLVLGAIPQGGTFVALTVLCTMYSRGFEAGYLLLKPAAPILCSFAAAFDAASAMFGSYVVAVKTKQFEHVELKHYI
ncbi:MAG: dicarboxylate/amino acid:cation symporter [Treponema sp.]|nr:dicarboxylate/amino acid:cation symporter [Treponema sp.]